MHAHASPTAAKPRVFRHGVRRGRMIIFTVALLCALGALVMTAVVVRTKVHPSIIGAAHARPPPEEVPRVTAATPHPSSLSPARLAELAEHLSRVVTPKPTQKHAVINAVAEELFRRVRRGATPDGDAGDVGPPLEDLAELPAANAPVALDVDASEETDTVPAERPLGGMEHEDFEHVTKQLEAVGAAAKLARHRSPAPPTPPQRPLKRLSAIAVAIIAETAAEALPLVEAWAPGLAADDELIVLLDGLSQASHAQRLFNASRYLRHQQLPHLYAEPPSRTEERLHDAAKRLCRGRFTMRRVRPGLGYLLTTWRSKVVDALKVVKAPHILFLDAFWGAVPETDTNSREILDAFHATSDIAPFAACSSSFITARRSSTNADEWQSDVGTVPVLLRRPDGTNYSIVVAAAGTRETTQAYRSHRSQGNHDKHVGPRYEHCFAPSAHCFFAAKEMMLAVTDTFAHDAAKDDVLKVGVTLTREDAERILRPGAGDDFRLLAARTLDAEMEIISLVIARIEMHDVAHLDAESKAAIANVGTDIGAMRHVVQEMGVNPEAEVNRDPLVVDQVLSLATLSERLNAARRRIRAHAAYGRALLQPPASFPTNLELLWHAMSELVSSGHVATSRGKVHSLQEAHHVGDARVSADAHPHVFPVGCVGVREARVLLHPITLNASAAEPANWTSPIAVRIIHDETLVNFGNVFDDFVVSTGFRRYVRMLRPDHLKVSDKVFAAWERLVTGWAAQEPHFHISVANGVPRTAVPLPRGDCETAALQSHLFGAVAALNAVQLTLHRRTLCGMLLLYVLGGVYVDSTVRSAPGTSLASWIDVNVQLSWVRLNDTHGLSDYRNDAALDLRVVASAPRHHCLGRALRSAIASIVAEREDPLRLEYTGLGAWMFAGVKGRPECLPAHPQGLLDGLLITERAAIAHPWQKEREERLNAQRQPPALRIVFVPSGSPELTPPEAAAEATFRENEPGMGMIHVSDAECLRLLVAQGPFNALHRLVQRLPLRQRSAVCGLAAVHRFGGVYMHALAHWHAPFATWVPNARLFVASVTTSEHEYWNLDTEATPRAANSSTNRTTPGPGTDDISTWLFGAVAEDPAVRDALQHLDQIAEAVERAVAATSTAAPATTNRSQDGDAASSANAEDAAAAAVAMSMASTVGPEAFGRAFERAKHIVWVPRAACVAVPMEAVAFYREHQTKSSANGKHKRSKPRARTVKLRSSSDHVKNHHMQPHHREHETPEVPLIMWRSWSSRHVRLPPELSAILGVWRREEPAFHFRVVSDASCAMLIRKHLPSLLPDGLVSEGGRNVTMPTKELLQALDAFPVPIMKSHLCRLVALYVYGGVYADLDVEWKRPVEEWLIDHGSHHVAHDDAFTSHRFGRGATLPTNETLIAIRGAAASTADGALSHGRMAENWLIAATPRHRCIEEALFRVAYHSRRLGRLRKEWLTHSAAEIFAITDGALSEGLESCPPPLYHLVDGQQFQRSYARHDAILGPEAHHVIAHTWRHHYASLEALRAYKHRVYVVSDNNPTTVERRRAFVDSWHAFEPHLGEVRVTLGECGGLVRRYSAILANISKGWEALPTDIRLQICRFVAIWEHGGVYADPQVELLRPLATWMPLTSGSSGLVIAKAPPAETLRADTAATPIEARLFAVARPKNRCVLKVLLHIDASVATVLPQAWLMEEVKSGAVGSVAVAEGLRAPIPRWRRVPSSATYRIVQDNFPMHSASQPDDTDDDCIQVPLTLSQHEIHYGTHMHDAARLHFRPDYIGNLRITYGPDDSVPLPEALYDADWLRNEPGFGRQLIPGTCRSTLASLDRQHRLRWANITAAHDMLPHRLRRLLCGVLNVWLHGGLYMDLNVARIKPLEEWFPAASRLVLLGRNFVTPPETNSTAATNINNDTATTNGTKRRPRRDRFALPPRDGARLQAEQSGSTAPTFASWLFAAENHHPCMAAVLDVINYRLGSTILRPANNASHEVLAYDNVTHSNNTFSRVNQSEWARLLRLGKAQKFDSWLLGDAAFTAGISTCGAVDVVLPQDVIASEYVKRNDMVQPTVKGSTHVEQIPRVVHVVWKTSNLTGRAGHFHTDWQVNEPTFERRVATDDECRTLAMEDFPELGALWDRIPLPILRADTCRLLAVYRFGGVYMDLDVKFARPMSEWLNLSSDIVIAREDVYHYCNWFFAARPRHRCVARAIRLITERVEPSRLNEIRSRDYSFVHYITGPRAFTDGMRGCAEPTLTGDDMKAGLIIHKYASTEWTDELPSWRDQRDEHWEAKQEQGTTVDPADVDIPIAAPVDENGNEV
jgi:mannosyltransferase OCH1-like enzyme